MAQKKVYFIRVPEDMYLAIKDHAETQCRSVQMQAQILLGAALNRGLILPEDLVSKNNLTVKKKKLD